MTAIRTRVTAEFANLAQYDANTGAVSGLNVSGNTSASDSITGTLIVRDSANANSQTLSTSIGQGDIVTGGTVFATFGNPFGASTVGNVGLAVGSNSATDTEIRLNSNDTAYSGIGILKFGQPRWYLGTDDSSANGNFVIDSPTGTAITVVSTGGVQLGTATGTQPLLAANASTGPVTLTAGTAGQQLLSAGANRTPYWADAATLPTIWHSGYLTISQQSVTTATDTIISMGTPPTLPTGWSYSSGYWTNNTGAQATITFTGKIQVTVSNNPSNSEIDVFFKQNTSVGAASNIRPWQLACAGITGNQNIYGSPSNGAYHNFSVTLPVPNGQGVGLFGWRNGGTLNIGGTPIGAFGTISGVFVAIYPN